MNNIIALDLDGTLLNYGATRAIASKVNVSLVHSLPAGMPVAILTNQGGIAFSRLNPAEYPSPARVVQRMNHAWTYLTHTGHPVDAIYACVWHPRADEAAIQWAARQLRGYLAVYPCHWRVYTTERARKPSPLMLRAVGAVVYYGDSPEDEQAAIAAGIPFVAVPRFF